jgi:hypothetical protein
LRCKKIFKKELQLKYRPSKGAVLFFDNQKNKYAKHWKVSVETSRRLAFYWRIWQKYSIGFLKSPPIVGGLDTFWRKTDEHRGMEQSAPME